MVIYDLWSTKCQEQRPKISVLKIIQRWNPEMKQCALQDFLNLISYRAWNYLLKASTTHNGLDHPTCITN